jgi:hypothetical protein
LNTRLAFRKFNLTNMKEIKQKKRTHEKVRFYKKVCVYSIPILGNVLLNINGYHAFSSQGIYS